MVSRAAVEASQEMVRRYAHFSAEQLAPYADRLCAVRAVEGPADGTFTAQSINDEGAASLQPLEKSGAPGRT